MILADSEVASLKAAIRWWESFGYASTAVVGLGCIGEFVAEFTAISKDENRKHKLSRLSLIILIFGIAGELLSAVRTSNLSGELIANIEERAAKAEQKAGEANDRAAANEKEAAQLRKYAEDERLRRTELEATLAWRRLTPKDNVLFSNLNHFNDTPVGVWYNAGDGEGANFAWEFAQMAHAHKWPVFSPASVITFAQGGHPFGSVPGLTFGIEVSSSENTRSQEVAKAIAVFLVARGFDATVSTRFTKGINPLVIVTMETRPQGPQGEAKLRHEAEAKKENK